jgi:hypothetical protein
MPHLARQKKNALYLSLENDLFKVVFKNSFKRMDGFLIIEQQFLISFIKIETQNDRRTWQNLKKPLKV